MWAHGSGGRFCIPNRASLPAIWWLFKPVNCTVRHIGIRFNFVAQIQFSYIAAKETVRNGMCCQLISTNGIAWSRRSLVLRKVRIWLDALIGVITLIAQSYGGLGCWVECIMIVEVTSTVIKWLLMVCTDLHLGSFCEYHYKMQQHCSAIKLIVKAKPQCAGSRMAGEDLGRGRNQGWGGGGKGKTSSISALCNLLLWSFSPWTCSTKSGGGCPRRPIGGPRAYWEVSINVVYLSSVCLWVTPTLWCSVCLFGIAPKVWGGG